MATRVLAALGADVVKIEGPARLDDWRGAAAGGPPDRYPDFTPGDRPYDRHFQFNTQNHDKRSLVLDLKTSAGRDVARRLIAGADVVMANFSVGTLDRMGLGWAEVSQLAPAPILVEMPAYGQGGPISSYVAYGPSMELMCGMAGTIGYGDGKPVTTGPAYLDPIGGLHGAAAVVTALFARGRSGIGQHVELAQTEAAMHWIGELIIAATVSGRDPEPDGNRIAEAAPHDAYRCAGQDEWIAIAAYDDDQFRRLCTALRLGALHADPRFASLPARRARAGELDALITARTSACGKDALAARLRAAGVPASAVLSARDLHASEFLRRRGLVREIDHPAVGRHRQQGLPLRIDGFDLAIRRPAPRFGEHNDEILAELGLSAREIESLRERRVVTDVPATSRATSRGTSRAGTANRRA
jgi:crotonobetainyl-CoA:carnitine CoA-transferase CaiB-like acyl-CoA transferase